MRFSFLAAVVALAPFWASPVEAQSDVAGAVITGTVRDATGGVLPGATVTATSVERGLERVTLTGLEGSYSVLALPPGRYAIRVDLAGFAPHTVTDLVLTVGQSVVIGVTLQVASVSQRVEVSLRRPLIETRRTQQANTIEQTQIDTQPNIARKFTAFVYTLPGVTDAEAPRTQHPGFTFNTTGFSVGGSSGRANLVTVDGGENEYGSGQIRMPFSPDAIREIQVNRNAFAAEFGFTAGTAVNVVTRSGTNAFAGSAYTYYRSHRLASRNAFDTVGDEAEERVLTPGVSAGGPLRRDRTFYFGSYERLDAHAARFKRFASNPELQGPSTSALVSADLRAQAAYLSALDSSGDATIRRIAGDLRAVLTPGNFAHVRQLADANSGTFIAPDQRHHLTLRLDHQATDRDALVLRGTYYRTNTDFLIADAPTTAPSGSTRIPQRDAALLATWTRTLGARALGQTRLQFVKDDADVLPMDAGSTALSIEGFGNFGRNIGAPFRTYQKRFQFEHTVSLAAQRHTLKAGVSYRPVQYEIINELWFGGEWTFASHIYPLILGVASPADQQSLAIWNLTHVDPSTGAPYPAAGPSALTGLQSFGMHLPFLLHQGFNNPRWTGWAHTAGVFAQDTWQAGHGLTLDYGLRLDVDGEPAPLRTQTTLSPRVAAAWAPDGSERLVLRAGGGLYSAPTPFQVPYLGSLLDDSGRYINQILKSPLDGAQSPPALWGYGVAIGKLPSGSLSEADLHALGVNTGPGTPGRILFEVSPDFRSASSIQASGGLTWRLREGLALDVGYLYSRGRNLPFYREANYREAPGAIDPLLGPRYVAIDPAIIQRNVTESTGRSRHHGVNISLLHPLRNGVQFQLHYTWSRTMTDVTDVTPGLTAFMPTRLDREWARSTFDITHNLVGQAAWMVRGFNIGAVVFARSGVPFTLRIGGDINGDTHGLYDRPFGADRNSGRGPGYFSIDLRVSRRITLPGERLALEVMGEVANVLNRVNYIAVNDVIGLDPELLRPPYNRRGDASRPASSPLGFTAAAAARQGQLALRLYF